MSTLLKDYIARLDRIGAGSPLAAMKREVATEGLKVIDEGFRTETNPYGGYWQPLKPPVRKSGAGILDDTGAMRHGFFAWPTSIGVRFMNTRLYAAAQNYGRSEANLPSRRMLPTVRLGLGFKWREMLARVFNSTMRKALSP